MGTVSDLVAEIQQSFDVDPADALAVLDRRHKLMCDRARWYRQVRPATASDGPFPGTSTITMPTDAVEVFSIQVTDATTLATVMYHRTRMEDLEAISNGTLGITGLGGVFVEQGPGSLNVTPLVLYPALAVDASVLLHGAFIPDDLTLSPDTNTMTPADFDDGLLAGVYATLLSRPNEARPDLAATQEQTFEASCAELRDRSDRRFRTKGPRQIRTQFDS